MRLRHTQQQTILEFGIPVFKWQPGNDSLLLQLVPHRTCFWDKQNEFVEERRRKMLPAGAVLQQQVTCVMTFFDIAFGEFTQPLFSHRAKEYRCRERTESLISADIRGGFFAANMLLASRECQ